MLKPIYRSCGYYSFDKDYFYYEPNITCSLYEELKSITPHDKIQNKEYKIQLDNIFSIDVKSLSKSKPKNDCICGVYFLFNKGNIVYIGKSTNVLKRVFNHIESEKVFDEYSYLELDEFKIELYERLLINKYFPKYNNDSITRRLKREGKHEIN